MREVGDAARLLDPGHRIREARKLRARRGRIRIDAHREDVRLASGHARRSVELGPGDDQQALRRRLHCADPVVGDHEHVETRLLVVASE
jgi:hypothetical protein